MPRNAMSDERYALEPGTVTVYAKFTGGGQEDSLVLSVDGGTAAFEVGEVVTSGGGGSGEGTIVAIENVTGLWADAASLAVDAGSVEFTVGDTVVGQTSGETATITRIDTLAGDWDPANHTGTATLILTDASGTFSDGEDVLGVLGGVAVADGDSAALAEGEAVLYLTGVTGTFADDDALTGDVAGVALAGGAGSAGTYSAQPTGVSGAGIASVVSEDPDAPGALTVTLSDKWAGLLSFSSCILTSDTAAAWECTVKAEDVDGDKEINLAFFKGGTATEPGTTETVMLEFVLASAPSVPSSF